MTNTIKITIKTTITIDAGIHKGAKTHNHGQSILSMSFKVTKTIVKRPQKPIPLLELLDVFLDMFSPIFLV
jgi:hypothetical protein